jgi:hypothetical protein
VSFWTDEKRARFRELHGEGKPFAVIAELLGTTRNAIAGAASRLGLSRRPSGRQESPVRPVRVRTRPAKGTDRTVIVDQPDRSVPEVPTLSRSKVVMIPVAVDPKFLWDLRYRECKWPVDRREGFHVHCAAPMAEDDFSYCAAHRKLSTRVRVD